MLQKTMALRGQRNSQSITIVSGSTPPQSDLGVTILVPESPFSGQVATIQFDWLSPAYGGSAAGVTGFNIGDIFCKRRFSNGEASVTPFNFQQISPSSYSVQVQIEAGSLEYTIRVAKNAATLIADPKVIGPAEPIRASFTIGTLTVVKPIVNIGVPAVRPVTVRPVPLTFEWVHPDDTSVNVQDFGVGDVSADVGTLGNFAQVSGDPSKYTADLTIPQGSTATAVTVTVSADSAQVVGATPAVLGPEAATTYTFEIGSPPPALEITGADTTCVLEKRIPSADYLNAVIPHLGYFAGGAFTGVLEAVTIGTYLYLVVQIRKFTQTVDDDGDLVTPKNPSNFLSNLQAGAALVRANTQSQYGCRFRLLKAYSDVTLAARSLTFDGTTLYFIEGSHYMYADPLIFSDRQWREKVGNVYKIEHPSLTIQEVGRNWRSATPEENPDTETIDYFYGIHGATPAPMTVVDDALNMVTGYGNFDNIGQPRGKHPVNRIGNWNWIQYDDQINQRLSEVVTNGRTGFDILKAIAILTNSILGFKNDTFFLRPREPQHALSNNGSYLLAMQRTIKAKDLNWGEFPSEGWLRIHNELIKHTGANADGHFENVLRGVAGTLATAHTGDFEIQFVDHILSLTPDTLQMPITSVVAQNDSRQFYNQVRLRYGGDAEVFVEDTPSITANGARVLDVEVPLDAHQRAWARWLAHTYLSRFKDVHQILQLKLKPSFFISVADTVVIQVPERIHLHNTLCQVLEVRHSFKKPPSTFVKMVTL